MVDLTLVGNAKFADGIGRHALLFANTLGKSNLDVNFKVIGEPIRNWKEVLPNAFKTLSRPFNGYGKISFYTYIIGLDNDQLLPLHQEVISSSKKAFAYSMLESDALPPKWKDVLNKYAKVIVPDPFYIDVYKNSGVRVPVEVMPLPIILDEFFAIPKKKRGEEFIFGMAAGAWDRKGFVKLIKCFKKLYGSNPAVKLKLHSRFGSGMKDIIQALNDANCSNIIFTTGEISRKDYVQWMSDLDCYVFPSRGEGYSISPREAMAAQIPTIILNHTAHKTICDSGWVISVPANKKIPAAYEVFGGKTFGNFFDCEDKDLMDAMERVVKAPQVDTAGGKEWVEQFTCEALASKYTEFFKKELADL